MKKIILIFLVFFYVVPLWAQEGFRYVGKRNKLSFPFQLINNLVFIPIQVNGAQLTFLLDSGVEQTILFGLEETKDLNLKNAEKIRLIGLGGKDFFEGLRSTGNTLLVKELLSENHLIYIVLDPEFNLSSLIGIPVNGIIGYSFFKNNLVEINYEKEKVFVYKDNVKNRKKIEKKYVKVPVTIEKAKPYVEGVVMLDSVPIPVKLMLDNGNSDAIWLFQNVNKQIVVPEKNFDDYLGQGLSGEVEGKKARIAEFSISKFTFKKPIVAFPDSLSIKNLTLIPGRVGSLGGEILKRFSVIFDYPNKAIYLRKNRVYNAPFSYNKSGIEVRHVGTQWVNEKIQLQTVPLLEGEKNTETDKNNAEFKYEFKLKPVYEISNIRKDSPAFNSGLQEGDIIISINNDPAFKYSLQEINFLLKQEEEKWIELEIERNKQKLKFRFQLLNIL